MFTFSIVSLWQINEQIGNISVQAQDFGESVFEPGKTFVFAHFDGVMGLAYPSLTVGRGFPVFDNMMKQELVEEPVFSFILNRSVVYSEKKSYPFFPV